MFAISASFVLFSSVFIGVFSLPLSPGSSEEVTNVNQRFALFKNPEGQFVLLDLKLPDLPGLLDYSVDPDKVEFHLYTRQNIDESIRIYSDDVQGLKNTSFNANYKTIILTHGFLNNLNSDTIQTIKDNFLKEATYENFNIIAVDWSYYTEIYIEVLEKAKGVGDIIGGFMDYLVKSFGVSLDDLHCIGHSMGAHACGFAGAAVKSGKIARITGLDPARPGFDPAKPETHLDAGDAKFVDCIHTCGGFLGIADNVCSADYYPNSGKSQPGCYWYDFGSCSHGRSHEYFSESILPDHIFPSFTCESTVDFSADTCVYQGAEMGYPALPKYKGIFYTETNSAFPYAKNWTFLDLEHVL